MPVQGWPLPYFYSISALSSFSLAINCDFFNVTCNAKFPLGGQNSQVSRNTPLLPHSPDDRKTNIFVCSEQRFLVSSWNVTEDELVYWQWACLYSLSVTPSRLFPEFADWIYFVAFGTSPVGRRECDNLLINMISSQFSCVWKGLTLLCTTWQCCPYSCCRTLLSIRATWLDSLALCSRHMQ